MEPKLKQKLNDVVESVLTTWKTRGLPEYTKVPPGTETVPPGTEPESKALTRLRARIKWRLRKEGEWAKVRGGLADDGLDQILRPKLRAARPPEPAQLPLPGFEHVPRSLGSGKYRVRLPQVPIARFLKFESRYQARAERNKQTAEELRRIAEMVRPYEETDPEMALAEAMQKAQAASVVVMTPRKA